MRKALAVVTALAVCVGYVAAGQASSPQADVWACNSSRVLTVLFHPQGHAQIQSLRFPAWNAPHVEFYRGSRPSLETYLIYAGTRGQGGIPAFSVNPSCSLGDATRPFLTPPSLRKVTTATMLTCTFARSGRFLSAKTGPGTHRIQAVLGSRVVVDATTKRSGSTLRFAAANCKRSAIPT